MPHSDHLVHAKNRAALKKKKLSPFDIIAMVASVVYPLSGLPQFIEICMGHRAGVSLVSWSIFMAMAALLLTYGIKNRVPPMIIGNSLWIVVDGLVVSSLIFG